LSDVKKAAEGTNFYWYRQQLFIRIQVILFTQVRLKITIGEKEREREREKERGMKYSRSEENGNIRVRIKRRYCFSQRANANGRTVSRMQRATRSIRMIRYRELTRAFHLWWREGEGGRLTGLARETDRGIHVHAPSRVAACTDSIVHNRALRSEGM